MSNKDILKRIIEKSEMGKLTILDKEEWEVFHNLLKKKPPAPNEQLKSLFQENKKGENNE